MYDRLNRYIEKFQCFFFFILSEWVYNGRSVHDSRNNCTDNIWFHIKQQITKELK